MSEKVSAGFTAVVCLVMLQVLEAPAAKAGPPPAGRYSTELPTSQPRVWRLWRRQLPEQMLSTPWLARLDGVGSPLVAQKVGSAAMMSGFVCKPHDCMNNQVVYLFLPDGSRIVGLARLTSTHRVSGEDRDYRSELVLGEPGAAERACLETLLRGREGSDTRCSAP